MGDMDLATAPLAHLGHAGSINMPLLIGAGGALLVGIVVGTAKWSKPWMSWGALGLTVALGGLAFAVEPGPPANTGSVSVQFLAPVQGQQLPADSPVVVTVAVRNGFLATSPTDQSGGHLHLYLDGDLQQMPYSTQAQIELPQGRHELRVEYVDFEHRSFDPPIDTTISITAK